MVVPDTTSASKALSKPNELSMVLILFSGILQFSFDGADKFVIPNKQHTYNFHTNDKSLPVFRKQKVFKYCKMDTYFHKKKTETKT